MAMEKAPSLGRAYDLVVGHLEALSREATAIDTKLIATFASGSIIVGLIPIIPGGLVLTQWYWPELFFYLGLLAFLWICFWVYQGFRVREFYLFNPKVLREHYWQLEEEEFKRAVWTFVEDAYEKEYENLNSKGFALLVAMPGLVFEIIFLLVWTFSRTISPIS